MDAQNYVPLSVVASFAKMRKLTTDESVIVEALESSTSVQLDEEKTRLRPNLKTERNTIIIRETPADTTQEEIEALFEDCPQPLKIRSEVGDTWFVTMDSEDDAKRTILSWRRLGRTLRGESVKARLKSENILRSLYQGPAPGDHPPTPGEADGIPGAMGAAGAMPFGPQGTIPMPGAIFPPGAGGPGGVIPGMGFLPGMLPPGGGSGGGGLMPGMGLSLPGSGAEAGSGRGAAAAGGGKGNTGPPYKYTANTIIDHVKKLQPEQLPRPEGMDPEKHSLVVLSEPCMDLVTKQRSGSMEQAVRKGRPRFDSTDSVNSMDYNSLMYGDDRKRRGSSLGAFGDLYSTPGAVIGAPVPPMTGFEMAVPTGTKHPETKGAGGKGASSTGSPAAEAAPVPSFFGLTPPPGAEVVNAPAAAASGAGGGAAAAAASPNRSGSPATQKRRGWERPEITAQRVQGVSPKAGSGSDGEGKGEAGTQDAVKKEGDAQRPSAKAPAAAGGGGEPPAAAATSSGGKSGWGASNGPSFAEVLRRGGGAAGAGEGNA